MGKERSPGVLGGCPDLRACLPGKIFFFEKDLLTGKGELLFSPTLNLKQPNHSVPKSNNGVSSPATGRNGRVGNSCRDAVPGNGARGNGPLPTRCRATGCGHWYVPRHTGRAC